MRFKGSNINVVNSQSTQSALSFSSVNFDTSVLLSDVTFINSFDFAIEFNGILVNLTNFYAYLGQGIQVRSFSTLNAINLDFIGSNGFSLEILDSSKASCYNCNFINSTNGPAIYIESDSLIKLENSVFYNLSSTSSPGMAIFINLCPDNNVIVNCTFSYCSSLEGGLIELQGSTLTINSSIISENHSRTITSGINILGSKLYIYNCFFYNQSAIMGSFLYGSTTSFLTVDSSLFYNGSVTDSGGAINLLMSSLYLTNSNFSYNSGTNGGAINAITLSNITISSCLFVENNNICGVYGCSGATIYFTGEQLTIKNSNFYSSSVDSQSLIYVESANLFSFDQSTITGFMIPGIVFYYLIHVSITNSHFSNLVGAIVGNSFLASNMYQITNCTFDDNKGLGNGGALALYSISANITDNRFMSNSGVNGGTIFYSCGSDCDLIVSDSKFINNAAANGGGIFYGCTKRNCNFTITNCDFENNYASVGGGAINWNDTKPVITNTKFLNNTAYYGNNIAAIPATLGGLYSRSLLKFVCAPGSVCNQIIKLELLDSYNNIMTLYNRYLASMSADKDSSISGLSKSLSISGVFLFESYIIYGSPGSDVNITISTTAIDTTMQKIVGDNITYSSSIDLSIFLRNCTVGEQISSTACTPCPEGKYLINPDYSCILCPDGGNCPGG